jgi:hypothetical protein
MSNGSYGRKSSKRIALGALAVVTVAVGAYACSRPERKVTAYCVTTEGYDGTYRVIDDIYCDDDYDDYGDDYGSYGTYGSSHGSYFWYYGGNYRAGRISGGSMSEPSGTTVRSRGGRTISRGGFGGSFGGGS